MNSDPATVQPCVQALSLWFVLPMLTVGGCLWAVAIRATSSWERWSLRCGRFGILGLVGAVTLGAFLELLSHVIRWASEMPLPLMAVIAGLGVAGIHELYERERRVTERRIGRAILGLRIALFLLVLVMLNQPVLRWTRSLNIEKRVAVLVDDSASMHREERLWTDSEILDTAALLTGKEIPDRPDMLGLREHLLSLRALLQSEIARPSAGEEERDRIAAFDRNVSRKLTTIESWLRANKVSRGVLYRWSLQLQTLVGDAVTACRKNLELTNKGKGNERGEIILAMMAMVDNVLNGFPVLQAKFDAEIYNALDNTRRRALQDSCRTNRAMVASRLLMDRSRGGVGVLESLKEVYKVDTFIVGDGARAGNPGEISTPPEFQMKTDLAQAFDMVHRQIPATQLAGVLLLSDGCDNGAGGIDSSVRRLGVPVHSIIIGGTRQPSDAALLSINSPDSIFLSDRVRVLVQVQVTGAAGEVVKVRLLKDGKTVDEVALPVETGSLLKEVRLNDVPEQKGICHYRVEVTTVKNEYSPDNNAREFDVAVSDDRLNVLLVDSYPRWEFKYLRNLFYGRDKSIDLQFVLLHPDELPDQLPRKIIPASASRPAGQAEASALPASPEEWRKFGVIILGDVGPEDLNVNTLAIIKECVTERGALLVVIAGPRNMPHRWSHPLWTEMMPVTWTTKDVPWMTSPDPQFRLRLTPEGRLHMLSALSDDATENDEIWTRLPPMGWRAIFDQVKPGAQLIAYAEPLAGGNRPAGGTTNVELTGRSDNLQKSQNALMAIQQYGQGKVVMLGYDQTWRLRYEVGDTYHHRFWGQIVRWGAGERLRAGGEFVRVGTDRLTYAPGETIRVSARLLDRNKVAVEGNDVTASIYEGDKLLDKVTLMRRPGSYGLYDGDFAAAAMPGSYRLKLEGNTVAQVLAQTRQDPVETVITVMAAPSYLEFMRLNADEGLLARIAAMTGGSVHYPSRMLPETLSFGAGSDTKTVIVEKVIWDTWLWFALVVAIATTEWLLRRKGGLV